MSRATFLAISAFIISFTPAKVSAENTAPEASQAIVVLDASGSMWGQIEGKSKIEIARGVTREIVNDLDPNFELGLIAYGHRRKGDCNDIEILLTPAKTDRKKFVKAVDNLKPKGMTPLSDAVVKAAEELKYTEQRATVILISDGLETCDRDPCAVGKKLEEAGVDFTTYVVGFDLKKEEEQQLRCLAEATGGSFLGANNAESLKQAFGEVIQTAAKPVKFNLQLSARQVEAGPFITRGVNWKIFAKGERSGEPIEAFFGVRPKRQLPPGDYVISGEYTDLKAEKEVTLVEDKITEAVLLFDSGTLVIRALGGSGGTDIRDPIEYKILQGDQVVYQALGSRRQRDLAVGEYAVEAEYGGIKQHGDATIRSGKTTEVTLVFEAGRIDVKAIPKAGARAFGRAMNWELYRVGEEAGAPVQKRYGSTLRGKFPAGEYTVRAVFAGINADTRITVEAGETANGTIIIPAGRIDVTAIIEGKPSARALDWKLFRKGEEASTPLVSTLGRKLVRDLPEGDYVIKAIIGEQIARGEASVSAGDVIELDVSFSGAG